MDFKLSRYIHISKDEDILPDHAILYVTRSGAAIEIANNYLSILQSGNFKQLPASLVKNLVHYEVLVPADEDELDTVLSYNKAKIKDRKTISFTIQPSANCQLGCHYCGQSHSKHVMRDDVADLMVARIRDIIIQKAAQSTDLFITWYGGEPITGLSAIENSSVKLMGLAEEYKLGYKAEIITNALALKPELFEKLVTQYKIMEYQITIDGTAEFHDKRRMLKNGTPSFDIIFDNVKNIVHSPFYQQSGARINIRCNVDGENRENVIQLITLFHEAGMLDKMGFYISAVHDWGDNGASKVNGIGKEDFAQFEIEVLMTLQEYGITNSHNLVPRRNTYTCMVVSDTAEVYDAFGNISTCWDVPYTNVYVDTPFVSGNLKQKEKVDTSKAIMRQWFDEIPTNDSWCKKCTFLPVCGGSCPKEWHFGTPACPSFKFNIDERLFMRKMYHLEQNGPSSSVITL
ncbi:SPASM domain-containing protein [Chitinophaga pendula]|uniref:radical SAM/SPASM domain-containing protein n=1 Tax=Chitinophaga TaxID=79328 RepID=UPI000BAEDA34|nr:MULTISPECIES: radical SAM protein [Chitinophaga]ASZ11355.1 hypothetical protein CK934_10435 [Chitinophaga sp. MD30]UCJ05643.1 SPASM domain-containing protein [Chitinophaga pendula]